MKRQEGSYLYRPKRVYANGLPPGKRLIQSVEKFNKIVSLRILGKLLRIRRLKKKLSLNDISSVLFIRYDALGDMVVTTPLWRILKRLKPSIKIGVAGSRKNLGIIASDPDIDIRYDYSASSLRDFFPIAKEARKENWDLVIMCKFNQKTRNGIISRFSTGKGYTVTIGTPNSQGHQALFSRLVPLPKSDHEMPMTEQLQHLLFSVLEIPEQFERPSIIIDNDTIAKVKETIGTILLHNVTEKYIVINCDAPDVRKWKPEKNIELARFIEEHFSEYSVFLISLPNNRGEFESLITAAELRRTHYFPADSMLELAALVRFSSLVMSPDTAIAHIASAEEKPLVGLYPEANEWLPYKISAYIILPKKGDPISTIPADIVMKGVSESILRPRENSFTIVRVEHPSENEVRI